MFWKHASLLSIILATLAGNGCVHSEARDTSQAGAPDAPSATQAKGSIEGEIAHPAHVIPSMRICAIGSDTTESDEHQARHFCVRTRSNQGTYRIDGLPADGYIVIAQAVDARFSSRPLGYLQEVQCIRAPCPPMPATVRVGEGAHVTDIDLTLFHGDRLDFPALPNE